jgi:capsular exopolysaccharide synthesis family protein
MIESMDSSAREMSLGDFLEVARRRAGTILLATLVAAVAGCVATTLTRPVYRATSKLLVQAAPAPIRAVDIEKPLVDLLPMTQPLSVETQIEMLQSHRFIGQVVRRCGLDAAPAISVGAVRYTPVIEVTVEDTDPRRAARVANAMLHEYQDQTRILNGEEIERARRFVEIEAQRAQRDLAAAERSLLQFRRMPGASDLATGSGPGGGPTHSAARGAGGSPIGSAQQQSQELITLENKLTESSTEIARLRAQIALAQAALDREPVETLATSTRENPRVDWLQAHLLELQIQRGALLEEYEEPSPRVVAVDAQIARLQQQLAREPLERRVTLHVANPARDALKGQLKAYQLQLEGVLATRDQLQSEARLRRQLVSQLGPWSLRQSQLARAQEVAEKQYLMLYGKLQDLRIRQNARRDTARILDFAQPPGSPVRPRPMFNLLLATVLGLFLGCCLALLREYRDDRLLNPDQVERMLRLPVLGYVPPLRDRAGFPGAHQPAEWGGPPPVPLAEAYRSLRTNVSLVAADDPIGTLMVTSARPREGKTTTAINLAIAMAMEGRRVILGDADLRRPTLHARFGMPRSPGLADVLSGDRSIDQVLVPTGVANLRLLPGGAIVANPAELLSSRSMADALAVLAGMADLVIFDTPPCIAVTDAQVLAARVEGVLLVVQLGAATWAEVKRTQELLVRARARTLGLVFNKANGSIAGYYAEDRRRSGREDGDRPDSGSGRRRNRASLRVGSTTTPHPRNGDQGGSMT